MYLHEFKTANYFATFKQNYVDQKVHMILLISLVKIYKYNFIIFQNYFNLQTYFASEMHTYY